MEKQLDTNHRSFVSLLISLKLQWRNKVGVLFMICWYLRWWWKIKCIPKWQVNKDYISCEDCILFCPSWLNIFHLAPCGPVEDWRGIENENLWSLLIVKWNWVGRIFLLLHKASGRHQARDNHYHSQKVETLGNSHSIILLLFIALKIILILS